MENMNKMDERTSKMAVLLCIKRLMDQTHELITSVDLVNQQIREISELTKGLDMNEIMLSIDLLSRIAASQTKVKISKEERVVMGRLMELHLTLSDIYTTEEIPTVRELSNIMTDLHIAINDYEEIFEGREGVKFPDKEYYESMFSLINVRIIVQK